jgi:hypothetical protein
MPSHPPDSAPSPLDRAKEHLSIFILWHALGLPGAARKICRSPFRDDKNASFSISDDGKVFHDFATGESGDVVAFVARAKRCTIGDAARELIRIAALTPAQPARPATVRKTLRVPAFSAATVGELAEIQRVRGWPGLAGLEIATQRGLLHACTMSDDGVARRAWAITDSARRSIQVRRIDGQPWTWNTAKAWTLGGSIAGWPIGAADIGERRTVLFCEGGPDFLAAHGLAWLADRAPSVAVVCVPGATTALSADSLPHFAGKHVRIFEHADAAGSSAGQRWSSQLAQAGATVDGFTFDPPHKDLADLFAATDAETLNCPANIFEGLTEEDSSCR